VPVCDRRRGHDGPPPRDQPPALLGPALDVPGLTEALLVTLSRRVRQAEDTGGHDVP